MPVVALNSEGHFSRIRDLQQAYSGLRQDLPLLDQRIELLRAELTHMDEHVPVPPGPWTMSRAEAECNLGVALHERFMHLREPEDLTGAERHLRLAVLHSHGDAPFPGPDSLLGSVLRERAYETKSLELAEEALSLHRQPVPVGTGTHPVQSAHYNRELGLTLQIYQSLSKSEDSVILEGIERLQTARALYADADIVDHLSAFGLCMTYAVLFEIRMKKPDFEEALSYGVLALKLSGPLHRDYYWITWAVSHIRSMLVWRFGDGDEMTLRDINDMIRTALEHAPPGWAIRLVVRLCFTVGLELRLSKHGREEDLSDAIGRVTTILAGLDAADSQWDNLQGSLSSALYDRFRITGTPESVEAAAHAASLALSRAIPGSPPHMFRLSHYAICRLAQYEAFGDISHAKECISLLELMVSLAPPQGIQRQMAIRTMLGALQQRYRDAGDPSDLNRAIELVSLSLEHVDKKGGYSPEVLHDAGTAFLSRFELTGSLGDLEQATSFLREAMEGCADDPYDKHHKIVSAYSKLLRMRYEVLHDDKSMAQALELQTKLLPALSEAHPNRTHALCGLACIKLCKGAEDGDANVEEAFKCLLDAMDNAYCPVYRRLKEVTDVLTYMNNHVPRLTRENALKLSLVYSTAIDLLPQVASFGLEPRVRLAVIAGAGQLTTRAAIHAISLGQLDLALQMLESGRSVFWTQGLHLRTPFSNLPSAIGERLAVTTYALARPFPENLDGAGKDRELARRRQLGADFLSTLSEARMVPGFEQLLRNPSFTSLVKAAERHPVVVFVAGETSSHALILLEDGQCREVALAKATVKTLRTLSLRIESHTKLVRSSRGMRQSKPTGPTPSDAYRELWTSVMLPIVDALCLPVGAAPLCTSSETNFYHRERKEDSVVDLLSARQACSCSCLCTQLVSTQVLIKCAAPITLSRRTLPRSRPFFMPNGRTSRSVAPRQNSFSLPSAARFRECPFQ
jgi:tetratricopeptide (TPR) repeat protein